MNTSLVVTNQKEFVSDQEVGFLIFPQRNKEQTEFSFPQISDLSRSVEQGLSFKIGETTIEIPSLIRKNLLDYMKNNKEYSTKLDCGLFVAFVLGQYVPEKESDQVNKSCSSDYIYRLKLDMLQTLSPFSIILLGDLQSNYHFAFYLCSDENNHYFLSKLGNYSMTISTLNQLSEIYEIRIDEDKHFINYLPAPVFSTSPTND